MKQFNYYVTILMMLAIALLPVYGDDFNTTLKKAKKGNAEAQCSVGKMYETGTGVAQDYEQAVAWYRKAAEQGNANAQCNLGLMYIKGTGVAQDYAQTVAWYRKAAEQGNANAQWNLGWLYETGTGVAQDSAQAIAWYRKSAERGYADAQCTMGFRYETGTGVAQDYAQAVSWYRKSAEQGHAVAQGNLGSMYYNGTGVAQDYAQAVLWYRKSAEQGHANAQSNLGVMYEKGHGVEQDYKQAVAWYRKSAEQGNVYAQNNLGVMYYNGKGVEKDYKQAVEWFSKSAEQGNAAAQVYLGVMYCFGTGVAQDYAQAVAWYRKSVEQGNAYAQNNLGSMYEFGHGVEQDYAHAIYLYRKSAGQGYALAKENYDKLAANISKEVLENSVYYDPFSVFAKAYIERGVNEWQKKGEFERSADWQKRVNDQTRKDKVQTLLKEAERKYIAYHTNKKVVNPVLGKYDADNEVFAMTDVNYGTAYMAVPYDEAQSFKNNWSKKKIDCQMQVIDDQIKLAVLSVTMPNRKTYTYRNTDAINYNSAETEYNFEPIDLNLAAKSSSAQQGQQNITRTTIKAGKSVVDTDIPQTNVSNTNTFVIIFANEDYKNVASVPFAKNDGAIFQQYCQRTLGIPVSNIHYAENAGFNDMRIQLAWLKDVCDAFEGKASVIVYYAGHGIPDEASQSAYLLPVDGDGRYVTTAYKLDDFYGKLGAMNAQSVTVFMDACFSGSKRENGMLASARGVAIKAKSGEPQGKMVVFSAAQGDETAYPDNDEQHGMFTYYLLRKLQETKGDVTLLELGEYITTNVRQQSIVKNGKLQTPKVTPAAAVEEQWQNWKLK